MNLNERLSENVPLKVIEGNKNFLWDKYSLCHRLDNSKFISDHCLSYSSKYAEYRTFTELLSMKNVSPHGLVENKVISETEKEELIFDKGLGTKDPYSISLKINIKYVNKYPKFPWSLAGICQNKELRASVIRDIMNGKLHIKPLYTSHPVDHNELHWFTISKNVPLQDIIDNNDIPWSKSGISRRDDITVDALLEISSNMCTENNHSNDYEKLLKSCIINKSSFKEQRPSDDNFDMKEIVINLSKNDLERVTNNGYQISFMDVDENKKMTFNEKVEFSWKYDIPIKLKRSTMYASYDDLKRNKSYINIQALPDNENLTLSEYLELSGNRKEDLSSYDIQRLSRNSDIKRQFDLQFKWDKEALIDNKNINMTVIESMFK